MAEHVLVERLSGTEAEKEPVVEQQGRRRSRLRDDRRMHSHRRAGHADSDLKAFGDGGDGAEDAPHEGAVSLRADPRVEVVGDRHEIEPGLLCSPRIGDEVARRMLFARQRVPERSHGRR